MNPAEKINDWAQRSKQFYLDTRSEMRKVSWPARQEIVGTTMVVIVAVAFFALYFFVVDSILAMGLTQVLNYFGGAAGG